MPPRRSPRVPMGASPVTPPCDSPSGSLLVPSGERASGGPREGGSTEEISPGDPPGRPLGTLLGDSLEYSGIQGGLQGTPRGLPGGLLGGFSQEDPRGLPVDSLRPLGSLGSPGRFLKGSSGTPRGPAGGVPWDPPGNPLRTPPGTS